MDKQFYLTVLRKTGLDHEEAEVYLSLLTSGYVSIYDLSVLTNLERTLCYRIAKRLILKQLVGKDVVGKKAKYFAEKPDKIVNLLTVEKENLIEKETLFYSNFPKLLALYKSAAQKRPSFCTYNGLLSTLEAGKEFVEHLQDDSVTNLALLAHDSADTLYSYFKQYLPKFFIVRQKRNIACRILAPLTTMSINNMTGGVDSIRKLQIAGTELVPYFELITPTLSLALMVKDYEFYAVIQKNPVLIATQQKIFDLLWEGFPHE